MSCMLEAPYYGARKFAAQLRREGHEIGRKHVRTLMWRMGIEALYRKPRTSIPAREAAIYPYLLENRLIERPNEAWASDITYLPMAHGFLYLMAIIDLASRKVLAWRLSNTLTADFCIEALEEALKKFGPPEIFNTDQGSHERGVAGAAEGRRRGDQHGWPRSLDRQRVHRAAVEEREIRGGVSAGVPERARGAALTVKVLRVLQRAARSRDPRLRHA